MLLVVVLYFQLSFVQQTKMLLSYQRLWQAQLLLLPMELQLQSLASMKTQPPVLKFAPWEPPAPSGGPQQHGGFERLSSQDSGTHSGLAWFQSYFCTS